jgi:two-component system cell cycle sensor histidine kinase/response regulator CckA
MRDEQNNKAESLAEITALRERIQELEKANGTIRESEQRWRSLIESLPDIVMTVDREGTLLFVNHTVPGITTEQAIGKSVYDYIPDEHHHVIRESLKRVFQIGESDSYELAGVGPYGKTSWYRSRVGPIKKDGKIVAVGIVTTDVTELKKAADSLKESEQRFRAIFNSAADGIVLVDVQDKHFDTANETFCQMLGYSNEEVESLGVADIHPEPDLPRVIEVFEKQARGEIKIARDVPVKRSNGYVFYADINSIPITLAGKKYLMGIFRDVTDRKAIEDALRESEDKYRSLVEEMADVIYTLDTEGNVTSVNKAGKAAFGREAPEVIGKSFTNWIPQKYQPDAIATFKRILGGEKVTAETVLLGKDGEPHNVEFSSTPMIKDGTVVGTRGIMRDVTWRKQAEQKLRESEEKFRQLVSTTTDAIMLFDAETRQFIEVNRACEELYGYTREEFLKLRQFNITAEPQESDASIKKTLQGKLSKIPLRYHRKKDGTIFPVEISASTFEIAGRRVLCGVVRDITDRKKAEDELQEAQAKYRALVEEVPAITYTAMLDQTSTTTYVSPQINQILGFSQSDYKDDPGFWSKHLHPEDRQRVMTKVAQCHETQQPFAYEYRMITKDGHTKWISDHARIVQDNHGNPLCLQGVMLDVTDRKRVEKALAESELKYRTIVESAGEAILRLDRNGVILFINSTGAKRLGGKPEDYIGKTLRDIFPKHTADRQISSIHKVMRTGIPLNTTNAAEFHGQLRWNYTTTEPLRDSTGKISSVMVIARDIHERKQAEEQLQRYREEMARTEQLASLGTLSATLAHELTQPLTVVRLSIQNLLARPNVGSYSKAVRKDLKEALTGVSSAAAIIDRFRYFARKSTEKTTSKVDLEAVGNKIIRLLNESAQQVNVTVCLRDFDNMPAIYMCERDLEQLFFALIENAIQAADGKKEREITIRSALKDSHIELQFFDNCGGIASEHLDKIFEPFFTTKPVGQGTGLGLCIVQRIVSERGGHIRVENEYGKGCTFFVTLPIRQEH